MFRRQSLSPYHVIFCCRTAYLSSIALYKPLQIPMLQCIVKLLSAKFVHRHEKLIRSSFSLFGVISQENLTPRQYSCKEFRKKGWLYNSCSPGAFIKNPFFIWIVTFWYLVPMVWYCIPLFFVFLPATALLVFFMMLPPMLLRLLSQRHGEVAGWILLSLLLRP